uniref:Uncharacterized protein n=1 Tax=Rhinopithecus bieti TaxID=61621 RepID=A0A2K6JZK6_RHIBE
MAIRSCLRIGQAELQGADSVLQSGWLARGASGAAAAKPEAELLLPPAPLPWTLACHLLIFRSIGRNCRKKPGPCSCRS